MPYRRRASAYGLELRVLVEWIIGHIGGAVHPGSVLSMGERSPPLVTQRNGYQVPQAWDTRVGTMDLHIPKLREGSYIPISCWSHGVATSELCWL